MSTVTQTTSDTPTGQPQEIKPEDYPKPTPIALEFLEFIGKQYGNTLRTPC